MTWHRHPTTRPEQGSVTLLVLALFVAAALGAVAVTAGYSTAVAASRAQTAADAAALGAATMIDQGRVAACVEAKRLARLNHARLVRCTVRGDRVTVHAAVTVSGFGRRSMMRVATAESVTTASSARGA